MKIKLAICTPSAGFVRVEFAESLVSLVIALNKEKKLHIVDQKFFYICGSIIPFNRQWCVEEAIKWGATHVLFIDDDMAFGPEVVKRLLRWADTCPIIAANCVKRVYPLTFMAVGFDGQEVKTDDTKRGVEEVMFVGNSVILIDINVFSKIEKPWFAFPYIEAANKYETEDYYFQRKALEAGIGTFIEHDASKGVLHIGAHNFSYNDKFRMVSPSNQPTKDNDESTDNV